MILSLDDLEISGALLGLNLDVLGCLERRSRYEVSGISEMMRQAEKSAPPTSTYTGRNPVNFVDPVGLEPLSRTEAGLGMPPGLGYSSLSAWMANRF